MITVIDKTKKPAVPVLQFSELKSGEFFKSRAEGNDALYLANKPRTASLGKHNSAVCINNPGGTYNGPTNESFSEGVERVDVELIVQPATKVIPPAVAPPCPKYNATSISQLEVGKRYKFSGKFFNPEVREGFEAKVSSSEDNCLTLKLDEDALRYGDSQVITQSALDQDRATVELPAIN